MTHLETAFKAITKANDALNLRASCMSQLQSLFNAISTASSENPHIENLCHIGIYLTEDFGSLCEGQAIESAMEFNRLREIMFK